MKSEKSGHLVGIPKTRMDALQAVSMLVVSQQPIESNDLDT